MVVVVVVVVVVLAVLAGLVSKEVDVVVAAAVLPSSVLPLLFFVLCIKTRPPAASTAVSFLPTGLVGSISERSNRLLCRRFNALTLVVVDEEDIEDVEEEEEEEDPFNRLRSFPSDCI